MCNKLKLSSIGEWHLRQLAISVCDAFTANRDEWVDEIKSLFTAFDTAGILDNEAYVYCAGCEDASDWYSGFINDLNSADVRNVEDVEAKIIHFGMMIDCMNGEEVYSTPDYVAGDYNIPSHITTL